MKSLLKYFFLCILLLVVLHLDIINVGIKISYLWKGILLIWLLIYFLVSKHKYISPYKYLKIMA